MMHTFKVKISFKKQKRPKVFNIRTLSFYLVLLMALLQFLLAIAGHSDINILVNRPKIITSIKYHLHISAAYPPYNDSRSITAT